MNTAEFLFQIKKKRQKIFSTNFKTNLIFEGPNRSANYDSSQRLRIFYLYLSLNLEALNSSHFDAILLIQAKNFQFVTNKFFFEKISFDKISI